MSTVMTGIMPPKHHPRDRVIVLIDSKCKYRRRAKKRMKQEMNLEVDDLESISSEYEGRETQVKGQSTSLITYMDSY